MTLGPCSGERRPCSSPAVVTRQGRPLCASCDERRKASRNKRQHAKRDQLRAYAHERGELCDAGERGHCPTCAPRPVGRPPVVEGEETTELRVRVGESHLRMLDELVEAGWARDRSAATRRAIEEARRGR